VGEILKGLRLGDANPKGSPGTVDIDSIPDKLYDTQVDTSVVVGEGEYFPHTLRLFSLPSNNI
jgi:hypothetical protein